MTDDTDRPPTTAERMEELNESLVELRDEAILGPVSKVLNFVGIETRDADDVSSEVSLIGGMGAVLLGPVIGSHVTVLAFYATVRLTHSPRLALGVGFCAGIITGVAGLAVGLRYLETDRAGADD